MLVEDFGVRLSLEKKAIEECLTPGELRKYIDKAISRQTGKTGGESADESPHLPNRPSEGQAIKSGLKRPFLGLYTYRVLQNFSQDFAHSMQNLDLRFNVKMETLDDTVKHKVGAIVRVLRKGKTYSFESGANLKELYTYKAYLEKVVDGDTLVVNIDLGFRMFIKQRLRLRGLDAPELGTKQGATAKKFVESRLKDLKFLIIKTHGSDKYDRDLVDVFYLKGEADEEAVMKGGIFLNNEMIDEGLAGVVV